MNDTSPARGGDPNNCPKCGAHRIDAQLGLESTPDEYVEKMVAVFRQVRRVLRDDATLWLNLGDSFYGSWANYGGGNRGTGKQRLIKSGSHATNPVWEGMEGYRPAATRTHPVLKPKDLIGIPWRVALALQEDGWWLRSDIIWHKPNPMPESVTDRPTKSHEYIFLMTKSAKYHYDHEAVKEPSLNAGKRVTLGKKSFSKGQAAGANVRPSGNALADYYDVPEMRNRRSVWTIPTKPFKGAHFAVFPPALIDPCIKAGCPKGGTVLDPFLGAGTTALVALENGCNFVGCELNEKYIKMATKRLQEYAIWG